MGRKKQQKAAVPESQKISPNDFYADGAFGT